MSIELLVEDLETIKAAFKESPDVFEEIWRYSLNHVKPEVLAYICTTNIEFTRYHNIYIYMILLMKNKWNAL